MSRIFVSTDPSRDGDCSCATVAAICDGAIRIIDVRLGYEHPAGGAAVPWYGHATFRIFEAARLRREHDAMLALGWIKEN